MRNLSKYAALTSGLFLALTIGIAAAAQAMPQTNEPSSQPQSVPPAQSAQAQEQQVPPASSGAQGTPADEQGNAAPSSTQSAPPASAQSTPRSEANKAPDIDEELQLTPDQKQKIASIVDDENRQIAAVRDDNSLTMEQKQQKAMQIRQVATPKIKAILTPEQLQKLAEIQQRMHSQQQNGPQSTPQQEPSQQSPQH